MNRNGISIHPYKESGCAVLKFGVEKNMSEIWGSLKIVGVHWDLMKFVNFKELNGADIWS